MQTIEAIYENGVFRPLEPLDLLNHEHVDLTIRPRQPTSKPSWKFWLEELAKSRQQLYEKYGYFHDSTDSIREDRMRDL